MITIEHKDGLTILVIQNPNSVEETLIGCAKAINNGKKVSFSIEGISIEPKIETDAKTKEEPKTDNKSNPKMGTTPQLPTKLKFRNLKETKKSSVYDYDRKLKEEATKRKLFDMADTDEEGLPFN